MSLIQISHLTFGYEGSPDYIFEDITLSLDTDWKLGLIGRNGRGKTTLLNLLLGRYPYEGRITSQVAFDYFPFSIKNTGELTLTALEEVVPELQQWQLVREMRLLGVEEEVLYRPFETLSSGEQNKVMLAALFCREGHFLLIDEPTNHLDAPARDSIAAYLARKKGFILVSHDRQLLDRVVDHILSINQVKLQLMHGNFTTWQTEKDKEDTCELQREQKLRREIKGLTQAARRTSAWSDQVEKSKYGAGVPDRGFVGHKAAKMMQRAKNLERRQERAITEKKELLQDIEENEPLTMQVLTHPKLLLVELKDLAIYYGEKEVVNGVDLSITQGERVALAGKNGCGKTSLLRCIMGEEVCYTGSRLVASGLKVSLVSQEVGHLHGGLRAYAAERGLDESLFLAILRKMGFPREQFTKALEEFSEGQKKKVLLAESLCTPAHLYIWDEPLNFIDVLTRIQLEEAILKARPTLLFVEHDTMFTEKIATKVLKLTAAAAGD